jgi:cell division protein FtsL
MSLGPHRVYALLRYRGSEDERLTIASMVIIALVITALAIARITTRQELTVLGFQLARVQERVDNALEMARRLKLEQATLADPERIRGLAEQLGMTPVPADQIRVVYRPAAGGHNHAD